MPFVFLSFPFRGLNSSFLIHVVCFFIYKLNSIILTVGCLVVVVVNWEAGLFSLKMEEPLGDKGARKAPTSERQVFRFFYWKNQTEPNRNRSVWPGFGSVSVFFQKKNSVWLLFLIKTEPNRKWSPLWKGTANSLQLGRLHTNNSKLESVPSSINPQKRSRNHRH